MRNWPSFSDVRVWAYDQDADFGQDEDLLLHDVAYFPTLIDLIRDPNCPKREYIQGIISDFVRHIILARNEADFRELETAIDLLKAGQAMSEEWFELASRQLSYRLEPKPADSSRAIVIGQDLLVGADRLGKVELIGKRNGGWIVEYAFANSGPTYRDRLRIEEETGAFGRELLF